ncbi:type II toxin-antitoxin system death-on-curing family toxin [Neobacillus sp. OS1-32]|jgi:death-on-curing protein|uniref:Type II toxin-antitoxin system death-on-curing family toxin n=1 Tax=Neobacillus paridis TaxID=2803862 RepID=A0ABS1TV82_9BACI|nr:MULTISPECIES: type II toxin-antitoxin system death-on-curing family toxin [Neobacillus]MBL4954964.1 type II toxin-antitoxin system death-on-curing family toxin [Neobacillus paridis]WML30122.1 type II toxin-antitoxin system death-on-curing family toxin [Neobacillus sp. OS1-32]
MMDEIVYLTTNQVIAINTVQIRLYSPQEPVGVKDPGLLDSAINRPKQTVFGNDAYPSIYEKAAALFESIAKNHAFHNANKRTALASLIIFLKINHYRWTMGIQEEQDFTVDVVNHKYTFEEIVDTIKENTEEL